MTPSALQPLCKPENPSEAGSKSAGCSTTHIIMHRKHHGLPFCLPHLCQNKDLKSRVTHLEGSQRTNQDSLLSKLNGRIQELEERLQGEER